MVGETLITGATGFIGNHVTRMALEAGDEVRVMVMNGFLVNAKAAQAMLEGTGLRVLDIYSAR